MEYILIGKIVNTHGIKGELRIKSNFLMKERVFKPGMNFYIGKDKTLEQVTSYRHHKEFEMVCLAGYDNINQVLKYLKSNVYVKKDDLSLKEDEYILEELVGFKVIEDKEVLGKIKEIMYNNSNVLLYVEAEKSFYIPNNRHFIKKVDMVNKEVIVENARGLIL